MLPTRRQLDLLVLHSAGKTYTEIAIEVFLSAHMVYLELAELRRRLGARNLYHAQILALARGYVAIDGREGSLFVVELEAVA